MQEREEEVCKREQQQEEVCIRERARSVHRTEAGVHGTGAGVHEELLPMRTRFEEGEHWWTSTRGVRDSQKSRAVDGDSIRGK